MEENNKEIEKRLQELIRRKSDENSALHKLLDSLTGDDAQDEETNKRNKETSHEE